MNCKTTSTFAGRLFLEGGKEMKMTSKKMKDELIKKLSRPEWDFQYDSEKEVLRIEQKDSKKVLTYRFQELWQNGK